MFNLTTGNCHVLMKSCHWRRRRSSRRIESWWDSEDDLGEWASGRLLVNVGLQYTYKTRHVLASRAAPSCRMCRFGYASGGEYLDSTVLTILTQREGA